MLGTTPKGLMTIGPTPLYLTYLQSVNSWGMEALHILIDTSLYANGAKGEVGLETHNAGHTIYT